MEIRGIHARHIDNMADCQHWVWACNESREYNNLILRLVAGMPGGELLADLVEPLAALGWQEVKMIQEILEKIEHKEDTAAFAMLAMENYQGEDVDDWSEYFGEEEDEHEDEDEDEDEEAG